MPDAKTKITTTSAFTVTLDDGRTVEVAAGESEVEQVVADHWFTQAHLVGTPKGRMPVVEGEGGMMIEADEAGQRVTAQVEHTPSLRQEGPKSWSEDNPLAVEAAKTAEQDAASMTDEQKDEKARQEARGPASTGVMPIDAPTPALDAALARPAPVVGPGLEAQAAAHPPAKLGSGKPGTRTA